MPRHKQVDSREADSALPPLRIDDIGDPGEIDIVEAPARSTKKLMDDATKLAKFMEEMVTIDVAQSQNPDVPPFEYVAVEGRSQFVQRGAKQTIRRKYVEVLARARTTSYTQDTNPMLGEAMNVVYPRTATLIPFTVLEDTPEGHAWLMDIYAKQRAMAEAGRA